MYKHKKIVITGGPCAGKTTAMQKIVQEFTEKGYKVFVVNEAATELINGGIRPFGNDAISMFEFQRCIIDTQLSKERIFERIANSMEQDTIILCDRGIFDNKAYISEEEFLQLLKERNLNEMEVCDSYDMVIHLVTAANGAVEHYTTENNSARTETPEEATIKDKKTLESWTGHKRIEIINNEGSFDDKLHNVIKTIYEFLGRPYPIQRQHKFLIDSIDFDKLKGNHLVKVDIEQFFTDLSDKDDTMVRKTVRDGDASYCKTIKRDTDVISERITTSRRISDKEYYELLDSTTDKPIKKSRYCFTYNNQYYKLDIFEEPKGLIILETELTNASKKLEIPDFLTVKKEITDDKDYRNVNIYSKINKKYRNLNKIKNN